MTSDVAPLGPATAAPGQPEGFSLVEVLISLLLVATVLLSVAQMMVVGTQVNRAAGDLTAVTSLAGEKIEQLKVQPYDELVAGGSLETATPGYSDAPDLDGDGEADYARRWTIAEAELSKRIDVRVLGLVAAIGPAKEVTVGVLVAQR